MRVNNVCLCIDKAKAVPKEVPLRIFGVGSGVCIYS
jgi:hypothetical protein